MTTALEMIATRRTLGQSRHSHGHPLDSERSGQRDSEFTAAALCYAVASDGPTLDPTSDFVVYTWPWELEDFQATEDPIDNLVEAAAFLADEIDRRIAARRSRQTLAS